MSSSVWTLAAAAKSWRTLKRPPGVVAFEADAQVRADELAVAELQLVAGEPVDYVYAEMVVASRCPTPACRTA